MSDQNEPVGIVTVDGGEIGADTLLSRLKRKGGNHLIPHTIALGVLGLSEDGKHDLSASDREILVGLATDLHRRCGWEVPPCPFRLAALEGVLLYELSPGEDVILGAGRAYFSPDASMPATGLQAAHALAGAILLRRNLNVGPIHALALAAELLVPTWAIDAIDIHPNAPPWLVRLRRRASAPSSSALAG